MIYNDKFILNLCPTGMIPRKAKVPAVPVTPSEIAADVRRCRDAGASMVHLHARADDEEPTWLPERFQEICDAVADAAPDIIANVAAVLAALPTGTAWALAGIGRFRVAANTLALSLGRHVRVGLEDNPYFDWRDRSQATNVALVERIVRIASELGREPATPEEARQIIGLKAPARVSSLVAGS